MLTGSGAALFGVFRTREEARRARAAFGAERAFVVTLIGRARYRAQWWRDLREHMDGRIWPPRRRYVR